LSGRGLSAGREVVFSTTIGHECVELQTLNDFSQVIRDVYSNSRASTMNAWSCNL